MQIEQRCPGALLPFINKRNRPVNKAAARDKYYLLKSGVNSSTYRWQYRSKIAIALINLITGGKGTGGNLQKNGKYRNC